MADHSEAHKKHKDFINTKDKDWLESAYWIIASIPMKERGLNFTIFHVELCKQIINKFGEDHLESLRRMTSEVFQR